MTTGFFDASVEQKDRCGKASFDVTKKTIELLNTYFELASAPSVTLDPSVTACGICHKTYTGAKMACGSCHDNTAGHYTGGTN
jgi:ribosomal protein L37E